MNEYIIIEIDNNGNKIASAVSHKSYEAACAHQEIMEILFPEFCYLIYTADEWMYECENNA